MEQSKSETIRGFEQVLLSEAPHAEPILSRLRRAGLNLSRIEQARSGPAPTGANRGTPRTWLLYWRVDKALQKTFGLAPEILVLLIPSKEAQARDIERAEQALLRDYRLDRGVVVVIASDTNANEHLRPVVVRTGRTYVVLTFDEVEGSSDSQQWLRDVLVEYVGRSDLFVGGLPVFGQDFIGRKQELIDIRRHLLAGRPVGLYGLRKVGKTSMLRALRDQLVGDSRSKLDRIVAVPILVNALGLSFDEANGAGFMRELLKATYEALQKLGVDARAFRLPSKPPDPKALHELTPEAAMHRAKMMIEGLVEWSRNSRAEASPPILVFVDEYERLYGAGGFPVRDGGQILNYFRGLVQQYPTVFNFLVAGLDRRRAAAPRVDGEQNPLFNFLVDFPLAGLGEEEMNQMIRGIGKRLALRFRSDALDVVWQESGGHPFLARELGHFVHTAVDARTRVNAEIGHAVLSTQRDEFRRSIRVRETMEEIYEVARGLHADVPRVLRQVYESPESSVDAVRRLGPATIDHLRDYGILQEHLAEQYWSVRIGCFGDWLRNNVGDDARDRAPDGSVDAAADAVPTSGASNAALAEKVEKLTVMVRTLTAMLHASSPPVREYQEPAPDQPRFAAPTQEEESDGREIMQSRAVVIEPTESAPVDVVDVVEHAQARPGDESPAAVYLHEATPAAPGYEHSRPGFPDAVEAAFVPALASETGDERAQEAPVSTAEHGSTSAATTALVDPSVPPAPAAVTGESVVAAGTEAPPLTRRDIEKRDRARERRERRGATRTQAQPVSGAKVGMPYEWKPQPFTEAVARADTPAHDFVREANKAGQTGASGSAKRSSVLPASTGYYEMAVNSLTEELTTGTLVYLGILIFGTVLLSILIER